MAPDRKLVYFACVCDIIILVTCINVELRLCYISNFALVNTYFDRLRTLRFEKARFNKSIFPFKII